MIPLMTDETAHTHTSFFTDCPSCKTYARFTYQGEQKFPQAVADKLGLPAIIQLWSCGACHSTLSHIDLGVEE